VNSPRQTFLRFSLAQRLEHWLLTLTFVALVLTGMSQSYSGHGWAESLILGLGGIEPVRLIHRLAATALMLQLIYHAVTVAYRVWVRRVALTMLPGWRDVGNMLDVIGYNLGRLPARPKLPRYTFEEKPEYWALLWGVLVMVVTGFMLWNPIATTRLLPGAAIPAAKAAHGGEALLAVLAILVWHLYLVLLRGVNKSMITGSLSRREMARDHALELEQIESGALPPPPPAKALARRRMIFAPPAALVSLLLLAGVYRFVTFEQTAVTVAEAAPAPAESYQPLPLSAADKNIHAGLTRYTSPENCTGSGCHAADAVTSAVAAGHNRRVAVAGPNPPLAALTPGLADSPPNCLLCHAQNYQPADPLASAVTVGAAGGDACRRCHASHPGDDIHSRQKLACISCHPSVGHQLQPAKSCEDCHTAAHKSPVLNDSHRRLDCRGCHLGRNLTLAVDATRPQQNPETGLYQPAATRLPGAVVFEWRLPDGQRGQAGTPGAKIVPFAETIIITTSRLNPLLYAELGQFPGSPQTVALPRIPSHSVYRNKATPCQTCHGPDSTFDYVALGLIDENQNGR
jgi:formate dehydrogenase gamma subunit